MSNRQYHMHELDSMFKVRITQNSDDGEAYIEAPLPAEFGFSVGSQFTATFDANTLSGVLQKFKLPFAGNISKRVGVATTKFYSNPEPTEITFDLEFHAEYSARDEVVAPMVALAALSLGKKLEFDRIAEEVGKLYDLGRDGIDKLMKLLPSLLEDDPTDEIEFDSQNLSRKQKQGLSSALDFIGLIEGPNTVSIRFGNVYILDDVWVSSVTPVFSNVVDAEGLPLAGTCSVTAVLRRDPVVDDLNRAFRMSSGGRR